MAPARHMSTGPGSNEHLLDITIETDIIMTPDLLASAATGIPAVMNLPEPHQEIRIRLAGYSSTLNILNVRGSLAEFDAVAIQKLVDAGWSPNEKAFKFYNVPMPRIAAKP